tara:strand:+ start:915 stop:1607 length:693 start_codon:yes stop_codon:yes gene_type:complete
MDNKKKRVGLLGGTFDPIHYGHLGLARETMQLFNLQEVVFIPVSQSPHKFLYHTTSPSQRIAMLELALEQEGGFSLDLLEIERGGVSFTIDTLSRLKEIHPNWELFLLLGADAFMVMDTWKSFNQVLKLCNLLVGTRPSVNIEISTKLIQSIGLKNFSIAKNIIKLPITLNPANGKTIRLFEIPPKNISSSAIRNKVREGIEIKNLLPPAVDHYIMKNLLYLTESPPIID